MWIFIYISFLLIAFRTGSLKSHLRRTKNLGLRTNLKTCNFFRLTNLSNRPRHHIQMEMGYILHQHIGIPLQNILEQNNVFQKLNSFPRLDQKQTLGRSVSTSIFVRVIGAVVHVVAQKGQGHTSSRWPATELVHGTSSIWTSLLYVKVTLMFQLPFSSSNVVQVCSIASSCNLKQHKYSFVKLWLEQLITEVLKFLKFKLAIL